MEERFWQKHKEALEAFMIFMETIETLRSPDRGCPWDLKQNHESLRRYMIEEAYEASEAMKSGSRAHLISELGDVLLQVVLNAQVAKDHSEFSIVDVIRSIDQKMKNRHPHVFASSATNRSISDQTLRSQWEKIKAKEGTENRSLFSGIDHRIFPATMKAYKIGKIAEKIQFDWKDIKEVFEQLASELSEVKEELDKYPHENQVVEELGDIYFTLAQFCRHLGVDPEVVAEDGNSKFLKRFHLLEKLAIEKSIDLESATMEQKEQLWQLAKQIEKNKHTEQTYR